MTISAETCIIPGMRMVQKHEKVVDPKRYAESGRVLQGCLPLSGLSLPTDIVASSEVLVHYTLRFGVDSEKYVYIHGCIEADMNLECQRCLKPMAQKVSSEFCLSPVHTGAQAGDLPERYEAIFLEDSKISIVQIVEEELVLSLPIAPLHTEKCQLISNNRYLHLEIMSELMQKMPKEMMH